MTYLCHTLRARRQKNTNNVTDSLSQETKEKKKKTLGEKWHMREIKWDGDEQEETDVKLWDISQMGQDTE